jgi:serine/threonine-protein kinase OSR1/STK39
MSLCTNDWPATPNGYKLLCTIGEGSIGTVYKARVIEGKHKGEAVAVKMINLEKCGDNKIEDIRKNTLLLNLLQHPNILSHKATFISKQDLWLVFEIMEGGSVEKIIQKRYPQSIKDQTLIATILKETLQGLRYLHQNNQIHRDIKAGNILIGADGSVKISDFGVATQLKNNKKRNTFIGSPCWMAPEVIDEQNGYDFKADIWSLGITALELAEGKPPNSELSTMQLLLKTLNEEPPSLPKEPWWDEHFDDFISYCLAKDPKQRLVYQVMFITRVGKAQKI